MNKQLACLTVCLVLGLVSCGCGGRTAPEETAGTLPTSAPTALTEPAAGTETSASETSVAETQALFRPDAESLEFAHKGETAALGFEGIAPEDIDWYSGDISVAIVYQGTVYAMGPGETVIHAEYAGQRADIPVICTADPGEPDPDLDPAIRHAPQRKMPRVEEDVDGFFDDAVFMGDSTSYSLYKWEMRNDMLGDAAFLTRGSVSINSLLLGSKKYFHNGVEMAPEDALQDMGRKKLFIMLGVNDVPRIGTEETLALLDQLLSNILEKNPELDIYLQSLTPIRLRDQGEPYFTNEEFDRYNAALEAYAREQGFRYVSVAPYFKTNENAMAEEYSYDKVHANEVGNEIWAQALRKFAAEEMYGETE